ncbi:MAG: TetR family transcriptional regulator C-terminal domain-containing protein [Chloroflexota bacterium]
MTRSRGRPTFGLQAYLATLILLFTATVVVSTLYVRAQAEVGARREVTREAQFAADLAASEVATSLASLETTVAQTAAFPTLQPAGSPGEQVRAHFAGIRRLARTDPKLFVVMGELAMRGRRDRAIAAIVRDVDNTWQKVLSALLRQAAKEGAIASAAKADDLAALIVATLKGLFMLPAEGRDPKEVDRQLRALERLIA